ncbi:MAG: nucleotidyltransferase family protein [Ardenticatenaceae bacterium]|nr:nucleotidyltransferase family protein [Ardenticatenaceae bacterium]MCB9005549.1 nucleotidyltransferase family protein [Ardenticatenaceae bacterium]
MTTLKELSAKREKILQIAEAHGAYNVRVFGSVARGKTDQHSDIDFLVELEPDRSLLDLGSLLMDLQEFLAQSVDVITENALKKRIRERVINEAKPL